MNIHDTQISGRKTIEKKLNQGNIHISGIKYEAAHFI